MQTSTTGEAVSQAQEVPEPEFESELGHLQEVIEHAGHLLPAQGPITVFIHHNTLHALEDLPFNEAVKKGSSVFGCQPFLTEDRYHQELARGRIRFSELREALELDLGPRAGEEVPCFGTRLDLRLAMLEYPLRIGPSEELVWYVAEANALRRVRSEVSAADRARMIAETRRWVIRDLRAAPEPKRGTKVTGGVPGVPESLSELLERFDESRMESWSDRDWEGFTLQALWRVCCDGVRDLPAFGSPPSEPVRHRDLLLQATGADADALVNDLLIRFSAAFLDQGLANRQLPGRELGVLRSFVRLYRQPLGPPEHWMRGLDKELGRIGDSHITALELIRDSLQILGTTQDEWNEFISSTLLALRGWSGMVRQVEIRGDRVVQPVPPGSLVEFLAVRLLLDRYALAHTAREALGISIPLSALRQACSERIDRPWPPSVEQRAFLVFQLAQLKGLSPEILYRSSKPRWKTMLEEIEAFSSFERRRVFHLAYERRFYTQVADAVVLRVRRTSTDVRRQPRFQAAFCIDEREESIRRHLEELAPDAVTFGTAGFFSIPMYFRGVDDAHFVPLCPAVVRPRHWVVEQPVATPGQSQKFRLKTRRALGLASHQFNVGSRSLTWGAVLAGAVGVLASIPLVARTLFPRFSSRIGHRLGGFVEKPPTTRLKIERTTPEPGLESDQQGFTVDEMTDIAEKVLREIGLTSGFSRLVLFIGHGSTSLNNPHESAHDCGACGGARGGPNARALAQMLGDSRVRERLAARGLCVPEETYFLGGMHNTSNEMIVFFDLDLLPESHRDDFEYARTIFDQACDRDAHERSRRFESAPLFLSFAAARQHVEGRAVDLAQVRPEWGHATNAFCIVGRRERTRGLFLDRRAFLSSYDPTQDDAEGTTLTGVLQAVFPVCAGISLEYYFSYVDNTGWGSGTKLPHNVAGLLGVMDGASSDLRTGLPWQMVEIHEPVRILFIIETTPETMIRIMDRNLGIGKLCRNDWVRLAVLDPSSSELSVFQAGVFRSYQPQAEVLPTAVSSVDWYRGWRDHLEFAEIEGQAMSHRHD